MAMKPRKMRAGGAVKKTEEMVRRPSKKTEEMGGSSRGGAIKKMRGGGMVKKMRGGGMVKKGK